MSGVLLLLVVPTVSAGSISGPHSGYVSDVQKEREEVSSVETFFVVWDVEPPDEEPLKDVIFTEELKREFQTRYEREFGLTEAEQNADFFSNNDYYFDERGVVVTSDSLRRRERSFGEYMLRRLGEFHLDKKMKSSPATQQVYQLKDTLSNTKVALGQGYELKGKYNISANSVRVDFINPYLDTQIISDFNRGGGIDEFGSRLTISTIKKLSKTLSMRAFYETSNGELRLVTSKSFQGNLSGNITLVPNRALIESREVFGIVGASYVF